VKGLNFQNQNLLARAGFWSRIPAMIRRTLWAVVGLVGLSQSLPAQPPEEFFNGSLLDQPSISSPWLSLESRDRFMFSTAFGSMRRTEQYLPDFDATDPLTSAYLLPGDSKNSIDRIVDLRAPNRIHFGGEIGFLYGKSSGNHGFGREDYAGYIIGTVGNERFSLSVSYYRQETSFSGPRWRR
jgi:hypothetical protein